MRYWKADGVAGVEFLKWDASTHRYTRHSHEGYAIGVVVRGAHSFTARGRTWTAVPGCIIVVNPEDAHDGRPATRHGGYSYRMMYVDATVMGVPFFPESSSTTRRSRDDCSRCIERSNSQTRRSNARRCS